MTRNGTTQAQPTSGFLLYQYYLVAPDATTANIIVSLSSSEACFVAAVSYTGAKQSGFPDSTAKGTDATGNYTATTTVVASNGWLHAGAVSDGSGDAVTAGASTTIRDNVNNNSVISADSNATVGTGTQSLNFTTTSANSAWIISSFAPQTDITMVAAQGSFTLTGQSVTFRTVVGTLIAGVGSFVLTGISAVLRYTGWSNLAKNASTATNISKNSSTWTNTTKS
jgi:hypothetical protein